MKHHHVYILATALMALNHAAGAQSLLSLNYPMGIPLKSGSGPSLSLCGTGVGIGNDFFGLANNPANLGISGRTTFSSALCAEVLALRDRHNSTHHLDMNLRLFALSVPVGAFGAIGASFEPYSNANARFRIMRKIDVDGMLADTAELGVISSGGAITWQIGWGYSILKRIRAGIAYRRFNFNRNMSEITQMHGSLNDRLLDSSRISFATSGIRAGLQVPVNKLTIGISGDYFFINRARITNVVTGTRDTVDLISDDRFHLKPPPLLAVGCSWQFNQKWLAALDIGAVMWERFYSEIKPVQPLRNAIYITGGVQFIPAPELLTPKLFEIMQYRAGLRYTQLPGREANELGGAVAVGVPMQSNGGLFDIIFEYAQRRDKRFENYRETMFSLKLGINGARKWYQSGDKSY